MAMMKGIRRLVWWLLVLVVVAVGAVVLVAQTVDPNEYKPRIEKLVADKTGRNIDLVGELEMTFFPWVGVETGRVQFANAAGFGEEPMLEVDNARVKVKLLPLIKRELEVDTVVLDSPVIRLATDSRGVNNWDDLTGAETGERQQENPAGGLAALVVEGISVNGGTVYWQNEQTGQSLEIRNMILDTGRLQPGTPLEVALSMDGSGSMLPEPASLSLNTTITVNEGFDHVALGQTTLNLDATSLSAEVNFDDLAYALASRQLNSKGLDIEVDTNGLTTSVQAPSLDYNLATETLALAELSLNQDDFSVRFTANGKGLVSGQESRSANGNMELQMANLTDLLARNGFELDGLEVPLENVKLQTNFVLEASTFTASRLEAGFDYQGQTTGLDADKAAYDPDTGTLSLEGFQLDQGDFSAAIDVVVRNLVGDLDLQQVEAGGNWKVVAANLPDLLARNGFEVELAEGAVNSVSVESSIIFGNNDLALNGFKAGIDDTNISGSLGMQNLNNPSYRFDLEVDQLDLDRLGGSAGQKAEEQSTAEQTESVPQSGAAKVKTPDGQTGSAKPAGLPAETVQGLNADGRLRIGKLVTNGITLTEVDTTLQSVDNVLQLEPLRANLFGGSLDSAITYDVSGEVPAVRIRNTTSNIKVGELLAALEITDRMEGTGNLDADLRGQGGSTDDLMASMSGSIGTRMQDGAIKGYDLQKALIAIENEINALRGEESTTTTEHGEETKFAELSATFKATNGVFTNDDLDMKAPLFRVNGGGRIGLPKNRIDYKLSVNVVDSVEGQGGAALEELKGQKIPLKIYGPLDDPKITLDLGSLAREELKKEVEKQLLKELGIDSGDAGTEGSDPDQVNQETQEESLEDRLKRKAGEELLKGLGL